MTIEFIRERTFDVNGLTLTAKEWGRSGSTPVIALHGWLDNAATFDRMLPFMENIYTEIMLSITSEAVLLSLMSFFFLLKIYSSFTVI